MTKKLVLKIGGEVAEAAADSGILADICALSRSKLWEIFIVHGGGKKINGKLQAAGLTPRFIDGVRITDAKTLEIVRDSLNEINERIASELQRLGAVTIAFRDCFAPGSSSPSHGHLHDTSAEPGTAARTTERSLPYFVATRITAQTPCANAETLGLVGKISGVSQQLRHATRKGEVIPVVAPLGQDPEGAALNINADTAAAALAASIAADMLIFFSDVAGVLAGPETKKSPLPILTCAGAKELIDSGTATGGMIAKLKTCVEAIENGVKQVRITSGTTPGALFDALSDNRFTGTSIVSATSRSTTSREYKNIACSSRQVDLSPGNKTGGTNGPHTLQADGCLAIGG